MKTLFVTSIYSNLWGTEFGGRPSRYHHYRLSLLNILNLKPTKVVCFTSEEEIENLKNFFYVENNVSENIIEFVIFKLENSKYFKFLKNKKNLESMKNFDRCFEIQYNKFFWVDEMIEIFDYDRVYWFDAGLSHSGLFPDCFSSGGLFERNYTFNLFNPSFLEKLNTMTNDKFVVVGKNNTGAYYWSGTIPQKYYKNYSRDIHVVGGFFGGTPQNYKKVIKDFDFILCDILVNENDLYMEEQIISCLVQNERNFYDILTFDDWYKKENYNPNTKLFYEIFITSQDCYKEISNTQENIQVEEKIIKDLNKIDKNSKVFVISCLLESEIEQTKNLIKSIIQHTTIDFLLVTDFLEEFKQLEKENSKIINFSDNIKENKVISGFPNFHLKRHIISIAKDFGYDIIMSIDNNLILDGWDQSGFENFLSQKFDVAFVRNVEPQMGDLINEFLHFKSIIDNEFDSLYEERFNMSPNPDSYFFIIKNNQKLITLLDFWNKIFEKNDSRFPTYFSGVYLGILSVHSNMNIIPITFDEKFTNFIKIVKNKKIHDFYGQLLYN